MIVIRKTWQKATYISGNFKLGNPSIGWPQPIVMPVVFVAYGQAIRNHSWQQCNGMHKPEYTIKHMFDGIGNKKHDAMYPLWCIVKQMVRIDWTKETNVKAMELVEQANAELSKLETLKYTGRYATAAWRDE